MDSFPQPTPNQPAPAPSAPVAGPVPGASEPVTPASEGPFSTPAVGGPGLPASLMGRINAAGPSGGLGGGSLGGGAGSPIMIVLLVVFGLGALVFAFMAFASYSQAQTATKNTNAKVSAAVAAAKTAQQDADNKEAEKANESPFRSYVAPVEDGSFEIKFPKNWSSYVDQELSGTQVHLVVNPDFVRRTNGTDELSAASVSLIQRSSDQYLSSFTSYVKNGKLKQADITISGQHGYDFSGDFNDRRTSREIIIPVRDKVIVFTNENSKYAAEFNEILAQAKINP